MMRMPVAEVSKRPILREGATQLPQIIYIKSEMRIASLRVGAGLRGEENDGRALPATKEVSAGFDGPSGGLNRNGAKLGFPNNKWRPGALRHNRCRIRCRGRAGLAGGGGTLLTSPPKKCGNTPNNHAASFKNKSAYNQEMISIDSARLASGEQEKNGF